MRRPVRAAASILVAALATTACAGAETTRPGGDADGSSLLPVIRVTDGDTIRVARSGDEWIRLIGIDTPEVDWYGGEAECYGEEAGRFLQGLLEGERVRLEHDRERADRYGRTLAYVYLEDGRMVNLLLVRRGYAVVTIYPPNDRHEPRLRAAELEARTDDRGLWASC